MHVFTAAIHEVLPSEFLCFGEFFSTDFLVEGRAKRFFLFFGEKTGNHTDGQDVVDQLEEAFLNNVSISEQEGLGLEHNLFVERLQVDSEVEFFVITDQINGPSGVASNEGS